jgi:hypothetical protein
MTSLAGRLERLESRGLCRLEDCPCEYGMILDAGEPVPPDAPRCPRCGGVHVLFIIEVVVESREQAEEGEAKGG